MALLPGAVAAAFSPITREQAAERMEVCVTGVVTCVAYWQTSSCIIAHPEDPNGTAIYVSGEHPNAKPTPVPGAPLEVGDVLEVTGTTVPMFFAPGIDARRFARLGRIGLPSAPEYRLADFAGGVLDNRRARMTGVVAGVRTQASGQAEFSLVTREGQMEVRVHAPVSALSGLSDAEVSVEGIAMSVYNHRAEYLGVRMELAGAEGITVVKPAPADPFAAKKIALNAIMSWNPQGSDGHRRLVEGTVTAADEDGTFYLQKGGHALRATVEEGREAPRAGMAVEVTGFPKMVGMAGQLVGAVWRESSAPPEAIEPAALTELNITNLSYAADITYNDYDCRLVSLDGRAYRIERKPDGFDLFLEISDVSVGVSVRSPPPGWLLEELEFQPLVGVTGIARINITDREAETNGRRPGLSSVFIEAEGSDALRLVPDREWRERRRGRAANDALKTALGVLAALLAALFSAGVFALWRARARERDSRLLADERKRMAGDLHDTIEQHLAGARILLSTAADKFASDRHAAERAVKMAGEVLAEAKRQIRDVILNLRNDDLVSESAQDMVLRLAGELNERGIAKVRVRLRGLPAALPAGVKSDLVAIVRQAVTNALKHGGAKNIAIVCDPVEKEGGFRFGVLNDGAPFDASKALGPESGHFGLANMRERAKRSGMSIRWAAEDRWMGVWLER